MHRAVVFLLRAAKENTPDKSEEADHHIRTLDAELANAAALEQLEKPPAAPVPAEDAGSSPAADAPAPDTAKLLQQSKRFKRNG